MSTRTIEEIAENAAWAHRCLTASDMDGVSAQNFLTDLLVVLAERERHLEALRDFNAEAVLSLLRPGRLQEWRQRFSDLLAEGAPE